MSTPKMSLVNSHQIRILAGEPHSVIRVCNLQTTTSLTDAWGRPGKLQPLLISAVVSLRQPFSTAAQSDTVDTSTIHYGILSKLILEAVKDHGAASIMEALERTFAALFHSGREGKLDASKLQAFQLEFFLPKASLIGNGVCTRYVYVFDAVGRIESFSRSLKIHGLRIPTLVGLNPNERLAKQVVTASVEIEMMTEEKYVELEELVTKTIEESAFETLEALAMHICRRILYLFFKPDKSTTGDTETIYPRIKTCLVKPTAVTFADAPEVEILFDTDPKANKTASRRWNLGEELESPPFPLQGRLDDWIREKFPTGDPSMEI